MVTSSNFVRRDASKEVMGFRVYGLRFGVAGFRVLVFGGFSGVQGLGF